MSTFVELEKQVQKNAVLQRRIADLEAENARLRRDGARYIRNIYRFPFSPLACATCNGTGVVYPPAIFAEPVPDSAGEPCRDCHGTGTDRHPA